MIWMVSGCMKVCSRPTRSAPSRDSQLAHKCRKSRPDSGCGLDRFLNTLPVLRLQPPKPVLPISLTHRPVTLTHNERNRANSPRRGGTTARHHLTKTPHLQRTHNRPINHPHALQHGHLLSLPLPPPPITTQLTTPSHHQNPPSHALHLPPHPLLGSNKTRLLRAILEADFLAHIA